jgi:hypothetical protein
MIYDLDGMLPARAFQRDARGQIKPQSGGGGGTPAQQNVTTTSIPEYARPYVERSLGQASALTDISQNPYQAYSGQQIAAFSPLQAQAMQSVSNMQVAPQIADASNLAYSAGQQGLATQGIARGLQGASLGYGAQAAGAGGQYAGMATSPGSIGAYMSPFMQNAVDVQKQEAIRDYQKTMPMLGAQAAKSGAFGGSRQAITEAEAQRNVNQQLANIQATGSQQAYDRAMQSMQFGSNLGLQGLQTGLQGVQGAIGAGQYGLAGSGLAAQSAGTLGQLGQTQFGQEAAITDAQMRAGALQQAQEQKGLDLQYQQYQDSMNYPYKQLGFMSDIYRGLPLTQGAQSMYQNPSALSQAAGLGTAAYGLYQMGKKNGGEIKESGGLADLGMYNAMMKGSR